MMMMMMMMIMIMIMIMMIMMITFIIINQIHNEKSDWSRVFHQFTIACELDMINTISADYTSDSLRKI